MLVFWTVHYKDYNKFWW